MDKALHEKLRAKIEGELNSGLDKEEKFCAICRLLKESVPYYDWVGFYFVAPGKELILGPYAGEATEHTRIRFGQGICGQAAEQKKIFVVQDVKKETNYLSCSAKVQSEIVVPIFRNGRIIGELDIDSHALASFDENDRMFLEEICQMVSRVM
jgi:GAF domain-containing protein